MQGLGFVGLQHNILYIFSFTKLSEKNDVGKRKRKDSRQD
jgi:hypothetical protein